MPQFKQGNTGKPKGSKDHSWATISYWFEKLKAEWSHLTPNQRASYAVDLMKLLTNKAKVLPSDPSDSVLNADQAMSELKAIEASQSSLSPTKPQSNVKP